MPSDELDETTDLILSTCQRLREEDYVFTVEAQGTAWDVYRFVANGRRGTLALRILKGRAEVGLFKAGDLSEDEVFRELQKSSPN